MKWKVTYLLLFKGSTQALFETIAIGVTAVGKLDLITTKRKNKNLQPKRKVPRTLGNGWKITKRTHHRARAILTNHTSPAGLLLKAN